jgi:6-phosphogluconolactonase
VWFVVSGADKAEAVGRALTTPPPDVHDIPAVGVRGEVETIWFLDRESASRVP